MKTRPLFPILSLFAVLALGACEDGTSTAPVQEALSLEDELALQIIADDEAIDAALDLVDGTDGSMRRRGMGHGMGRGTQGASALRSEARAHFEAARAAYMAGDMVLALDEARAGRMVVAGAVESMMGRSAIHGMVEQLEAMADMVPMDDATYENAAGLGLHLGMLGASAREALNQGNFGEAGSCGVLGQQLARQGQRHFRRGHGEPDEEHVRVKVQFGATAVALATRILEEQGADEEQQAFLAAAEEYQAGAEAALEAGELRRAAYLANLAEWNALKAVVLPGGITDDEVRYVLDLATEAYAAAEAALAGGATELQADLLAAAKRMLDNGEEHVLQGYVRGVGALWRSAVISTWLVG